MSPKALPTIYDVAEAAGVSITTVSRVLNASEKVNDATRQRVAQAIDELGFVPKAEARARALRSVGRIGVLSPFFTAPSFVQRLRGVSAALADTNQELVIYTIENSEQLEGYLTSLPLTGNLDGLIILSMEIQENAINRLIEKKLKTVLVEYPVERLSAVVIDDQAGGAMAAKFLVNKGHRNLAFIGVDRPPEYSIKPIGLRLRGFRDQLRKLGVELKEENVLQAPITQEDTYQLSKELLQRPERPSAIFAGTDLHAMAIVKSFREMGLRIPEDMAIIGFDDIDMANYIGLTTIRQHLDESGRIAVELLMADMANPDRLPRHVELPLQIIERDTT